MPLKSSFSEASKGKGKLSIGIGTRVLTTLCKVNIVVQQNTTPNNIHMVVINGVTYKNGEAVTLEPGTYSLTWASGNGGMFSSWLVSGNLAVGDPSAPTTSLEVTCGGTLTLNLAVIEFREPSEEDGGYYDNRGPFDPAYTYDNAPGGQGEIREPTGSDGGAYDNRA